MFIRISEALKAAKDKITKLSPVAVSDEDIESKLSNILHNGTGGEDQTTATMTAMKEFIKLTGQLKTCVKELNKSVILSAVFI